MAIDEENIIEMTDEEGNVIKCELYDIVEFDGKQYALLIEAEADEEDPEVVLMKYSEEGNDVFFESMPNEFMNEIVFCLRSSLKKQLM